MMATIDDEVEQQDIMKWMENYNFINFGILEDSKINETWQGGHELFLPWGSDAEESKFPSH